MKTKIVERKSHAKEVMLIAIVDFMGDVKITSHQLEICSSKYSFRHFIMD